MSDVEMAAVDTAEVPSETPESSQVNDEAADAGTENAHGDEEKAPEQEERKFTQSELDELLQKRLAKERAKAERREAQILREALEAVKRQPAHVEPKPVDNAPKREHFASDDEFIDAKVEHALRQREAVVKEHQVRQSQEALNTKTEKLYAEAAKLPDFDQDTFDELPMSSVMANAIIESDVAPKLMAYMSANPEEAERISRLPAVRQAAELGKLEVKLSAAPKTTKAPAPIAPVAGKGSADSPLEKLSFDDYKKARQKQGARWAR